MTLPEPAWIGLITVIGFFFAVFFSIIFITFGR